MKGINRLINYSDKKFGVHKCTRYSWVESDSVFVLCKLDGERNVCTLMIVHDSRLEEWSKKLSKKSELSCEMRKKKYKVSISRLKGSILNSYSVASRFALVALDQYAN